jgi:hypothetical protein
VNYPFIEPSGLTSVREIAPYATSQEERGVRKKEEGGRCEGRKITLEKKYRVSDSKEGGE